MSAAGVDEVDDVDTSPDAGFTLVELLVAMGIFVVFGSVVLGFVLSTAAVTDEIDQSADFTGEARLAMERMSRELRQATEVEAATVTATTASITFWTDFDGDGTREAAVADPEVLTYRWTQATGELTLTALVDDGENLTRPVLAAEVIAFDLELRSSLWQHDGADGSTRDGTTTWRELDAAGPPVGNRNGLPDVELGHVDLVAVRLELAEGDSSREFVMQADLRNQEQ